MRVEPDYRFVWAAGEDPTRPRNVVPVDCVLEVQDRERVGRQFVSVHNYLKLALVAAERDHRIDLRNGLYAINYVIIHKLPQPCLVPAAVPRHRQRQYRQVQRVYGHDPRRLEVRAGRRQVGLSNVHKALNVEEGLFHIRAVVELQAHYREAVLRRAPYIVQVLDVGHLLFDGFGDIHLHLLGGESRHHSDDTDHRAFDVGHEPSGHIEADIEHRCHNYRQEEGDNYVRMLDGPFMDHMQRVRRAFFHTRSDCAVLVHGYPGGICSGGFAIRPVKGNPGISDAPKRRCNSNACSPLFRETLFPKPLAALFTN